MEDVIKLWQSIPAETRGAIELWAVGMLVAGARWGVNRWVPAGRARSWLEAVDWLAHFALGNSRALGQRVAPEKKP